MASAGDDLDWCQRILGDAALLGQDGLLWPREDLRQAYNDAYRQMLGTAQATRRLTILDVPGRHTWACTHEWETTMMQRAGTAWTWAYQTVGYAVSHAWEAQVLEDVSTTGIGHGVTQQWERAYLNPGNLPYRFALPRDHERLVAVWYDHRRLAALEVRELDGLWRDWMSLGDYPLAWTTGTGRNRTFELYEIVTSYQQGYSQTALYGTPRRWSGSRTWSTTGGLYGVPRRVSSPNRQYLVQAEMHGTARAWHTSEEAVMMMEVIAQDIPDLHEIDAPTLIPAQLQKYLRFAVLAEAWRSQGEGRRPDLAQVADALWQAGVRTMRLLQDLSRCDVQTQREPVARSTRYRPPRVQLPSTYPRGW